MHSCSPRLENPEQLVLIVVAVQHPLLEQFFFQIVLLPRVPRWEGNGELARRTLMRHCRRGNPQKQIGVL